ncbi:4-(cytidine 5'-diphospho)-2-C-methyl-D-erythritol kinase [Hasllibacter sp. MH4015]|uniref:4-(cytidine 5'-diphospho)-2-C-methyl-D-erythritol kinase n=1 Tax=Hasllibacter sp. MH4015 TaxID=2854029 RepID=UPI001CD6D452
MRHFAPAKVNLALHVTGRRADGYHLLDSLVVFADVGDWLSVARADEIGLRVDGPRAEGVPVDQRNLAWKAAEFAGVPADIHLEKHLPHAGGIGGGSADAAAVLRALGADAAGSEALGADVPVCVRGKPCRMRGIGEVLEDVPDIPPFWILLVNPGVDVPTGAVFGALSDADNPPMPEPEWTGPDGFIAWLRATRNDLERPAMEVQPVIRDTLDALEATEACLLARMSGSGATCFGLFAEEDAARAAADRMPDAWWAAAARVLDEGGPGVS